MHTRRLWPLVTILSVPAVAIFVVLVVAQAIEVLPALIAMAAMAGITALLRKRPSPVCGPTSPMTSLPPSSWPGAISAPSRTR
jgi:hypothetical protein